MVGVRAKVGPDLVRLPEARVLGEGIVKAPRGRPAAAHHQQALVGAPVDGVKDLRLHALGLVHDDHQRAVVLQQVVELDLVAMPALEVPAVAGGKAHAARPVRRVDIRIVKAPVLERFLLRVQRGEELLAHLAIDARGDDYLAARVDRHKPQRRCRHQHGGLPCPVGRAGGDLGPVVVEVVHYALLRIVLPHVVKMRLALAALADFAARLVHERQAQNVPAESIRAREELFLLLRERTGIDGRGGQLRAAVNAVLASTSRRIWASTGKAEGGSTKETSPVCVCATLPLTFRFSRPWIDAINALVFTH